MSAGFLRRPTWFCDNNMDQHKKCPVTRSRTLFLSHTTLAAPGWSLTSKKYSVKQTEIWAWMTPKPNIIATDQRNWKRQMIRNGGVLAPHPVFLKNQWINGTGTRKYTPQTKTNGQNEISTSITHIGATTPNPEHPGKPAKLEASNDKKWWSARPPPGLS